MPDPSDRGPGMTPCVSTVTTLNTPFADDVRDYAAAGCAAVEVWLTKLEQHLQTESADAAKARLADAGVAIVAAAYQGGLLLSQGEQRRGLFDHFKRRLELCQGFGIPTLLVAADYAPKPAPEDFGRALGSLAEAARWAAAFDTRLGLEFRGADSFCTSLDTAVSLVEQCGEPNVGVCLDLFHFYKGPSKHEDLARLTSNNLAHVQVCDVAGVPRELMTDADRVLPGEGDFFIDPVLDRLRAIGYYGCVSLELMNPVLWGMKAEQVADAGVKALARLLAPGPSR